VQRNLVDTPGGKAGTVLIVEFTLAGQRYLALNGGKRFEYTHAISFEIDCADQEEIDRLWDRLGEGGSIEHCGWLEDRYGVSWQIVPKVLSEMLRDQDQAKAERGHGRDAGLNIFPSVERRGFSGGASLRPVRASSES